MSCVCAPLLSWLCQYGRISKIDIHVPRNPPAFAFVTFEDHRDAEDAVAGRDGYSFDSELPAHPPTPSHLCPHSLACSPNQMRACELKLAATRAVAVGMGPTEDGIAIVDGTETAHTTAGTGTGTGTDARRPCDTGTTASR